MDDVIAEALSSAEPPAADPVEPELQAEAEVLEEEQAEGEETAPEPQKEVAKPTFDDDAAFADEALSTPEALRSARELIQEQRRTSQRKYLELQKRETRFKQKQASVLQLQDNLRAQFGALQNDIQALRNGDASTVLGALSRLSGGKNATELFEEISINLAQNGKKRAPSPEVEELRAHVAQLEARLQSDELSKQQQETQSLIAQEKREIVRLASDAETYPVLASFATDNPQGVANDVAQYILEHHRRGVTLDYPTALGNIESELRARFERIQPKIAPHNGDAGREAGAVANPEVPQVGKSLTPSLATQSAGISRAASDEELLKKATQELPTEFWAQFGMA